jgi:adenine-specific DNA-methyltransferase
MEKITNGHPLSMSQDIVQSNIDTLKQLFPTIVKEGKIDIKELEALLGNEIEANEEYYRFTWAGKSDARREANKPSTATLRPDKASSKDWNTTQNIFIEGDNLEVLKLLQKSYANLIKMIYIDPPYNTGKDFVYKDNYNDNLSNYLQITGQVDADGKRISTNTESDGRYHSNWLNMMYPRLKLARNLLKDDGVIFISIDDNEINNLKKLCDEIFGEDNYINTISVKAKDSSGASGGGEDKRLKKNIEYLLCYSKTLEFKKFNTVYKEQILIDYINERKLKGKQFAYTKILYNEGVEEYLTTTYDGGGDEIKLYRVTGYEFKSVNEISKKEGLTQDEVYLKYFDKIFTTENAQTSIRDRVRDALPDENGLINSYYKPISGRNKGEITKVQFEGSTKRLVSYLKNVAEIRDKKVVKLDKVGTLWDDLSWSNVSNEGSVPYPSGKKPIDFIKRMIDLVTSPVSDDKILDFFAGSGSTQHAVMDKNKMDGGNRSSILVQMKEIITEKDKKEYYSSSEFSKLQYISDITLERIRLSGEKIKKETAENDLFKDPSKTLDIGFKAFKLDSSNIRAWDGNPENLKDNLFNAISNIKEGRTEEDILFEVLLKYGLDLTIAIAEKQIENQKVYSIGNGVLFICVGNQITTAIAEGIGAWKETLNPTTCRVLFSDNGFANDVEKTNSIQILKRYGINEINSL